MAQATKPVKLQSNMRGGWRDVLEFDAADQAGFHEAGGPMTSSPFVNMARSLTLKTPADWAPAMEALPKDLNRTERIRQLLKCAGRPLTAAEIAWDLNDHFPNFGAHLVWLLLKYDIAKGRIRMIRHGLYRYNYDYDTAEAEAIRAAEKLLKSHGYKVKAPAA